jgi:uncharacterized membrane protein YdjX (TVP38/TMEM64 family)
MINIKENNDLLMRILQIVPFLLMAALILLLLASGREITADLLLQYTPENLYLSAFFIIILFFLKSLVIVVPIPVLYILTGMVFEPVAAIFVNMLGAAACTTLPYLIANWSGKGFVQKIQEKYSRALKLFEYKNRNEWFFAYILRVTGIIPCDIVSLLLGTMKVDYKKYLSATIVGMLPGIIASTFIGRTIHEPGSPGFIISCSMIVFISLASILTHRIFIKRRLRTEQELE